MDKKYNTIVKKIKAIYARLQKDDGVPFFKNYLTAFVSIAMLSIVVACIVVNAFEKDDSSYKSSSQKQNEIYSAQKGFEDDSETKEEAFDNDKVQSDASHKETLEPKPTVDVNRKRAYLTFDDGPGKYTGKLLDVLKKYDVKATFFVIGKEDEESIKLYKRIANEGHTLGIHSFTHDYKEIYASSQSFIKDFERLKNLLEANTNIKVKYSRFPGGSSTTVVKRSTLYECIRYLNNNDIKYFDWNALNGDAEGKKYTEEQLVNNVLEGVESYKSSVVLMHDANDKEKTVNSIPKLIEKLKEENVQLLPIDDDAPLVQHVNASKVK